MYKTFNNRIKSETIRWQAYTGKKVFLPLGNPRKAVRIRHLIRHYTACMAGVDMLDARDPYTAEHSMRVSKMCTRLGLMMRMPRSKIVAAMIAAGAHDIGKVGVPDSVLLKEGPLDDHEFDVIKHHPGIGADILLKIGGFEKIAAGVWHHHERWDGSGYPDQLAGDSITPWVQVVGLADAFDALIHPRVYKPAYPQEQARNMIVSGACGVFHPLLLVCFAQHIGAISRAVYP